MNRAPTSPLDALIALFGSLGELEWRSVGGGGSPPEPPFFAWRFKAADSATGVRIAAALQRYRGVIDWRIAKPSRNWIIWPERYAVYSQGFRRDIDAMRAFMAEFPNETRLANDDALSLVVHLRRELRAQEDGADVA
jgi:hypothetical protein